MMLVFSSLFKKEKGNIWIELILNREWQYVKVMGKTYRPNSGIGKGVAPEIETNMQ